MASDRTPNRLGSSLRRLIAESGTTQSKLAEQAGIDRTLLNKVLSGDRKRMQLEHVLQISSALCLSREMTERLKLEYELDKYGEELYAQRELFKQLIERIALAAAVSFSAPSSQDMPADSSINESAPMLRSGLAAVAKSLMGLIHDAVSRDEHAIIRISGSHDFDGLFDFLLKSPMPAGHGFTIRHLFSLESRGLKSAAANLTVLSVMLPFSLSLADMYEAYYSYHASGAKTHVPFPYYVVTEDKLLLLSETLESAVLIKDRDTAAEYIRLFDRAVEKAAPLKSNFGDASDIVSWLDELDGSTEQDSIIRLMSKPATCYFYDAEQIVSHARMDFPGIETALPLYMERFSRISQELREAKAHGRSGIVQYVSLPGLDDFLETGECSEYPKHSYIPFDRRERLQLIKRMYDDIKDHDLIRFFNPARVNFPSNCDIIYIKGRCFNCSRTNNDSTVSMAVLSEESFIDAADDFFAYLPESTFILSHEESLDTTIQ